MTEHDQPRGYGPDDQAEDSVRSAFRVPGLLAALGLVVVVGLLIGIGVQQHRSAGSAAQ